MMRGLLALYVLVVVGPIVIAAIGFALRDLWEKQRASSSSGNGHADAEVLEHTVEEVRAPPNGLEQGEPA